MYTALSTNYLQSDHKFPSHGLLPPEVSVGVVRPAGHVVDVGQVVACRDRVRQVTSGVEGGGVTLHRPLLVQQVLHVGDGSAGPQELLMNCRPSSGLVHTLLSAALRQLLVSPVQPTADGQRYDDDHHHQGQHYHQGHHWELSLHLFGKV